MNENEGTKVDALGRPVVDNSPAFKRWWNEKVERVIGDEKKAREEARTMRIGFFGLAASLICGTLFYLFLCAATNTDPGFGFFDDGHPHLDQGIGGSSFVPPSDRPGNGG